MKQIKKILALVTVIATVVVFAACGSIDASALVKSNLDLFKTGEVTDDILANIDEDKDSLQSTYDEEMNSIVDEIAESLDCEEYIENGGKEDIEAFVKKLLSNCKYEVAEEAVENDDGSYTVTVTAYPMNAEEVMEDCAEEISDEWIDKITSGEYTYTSEEQLMKDMYSEIITKATEALDEVEYGDGQEIKVTVEKTDEAYIPNEDNMGEVLDACMGI